VEGRQPALGLLGVDHRVSTALRLLAATVVTVLATALGLVSCGDDEAPSTSRPAADPSTYSPSLLPTPTHTPDPRPARDACYRLTMDEAIAPVVSRPAVACRTRHTAQTFKLGRLDLHVDGRFRSADSPKVQARLASTCRTLLREHVGGSVEDLRLSMVRVVWFTPEFEDLEAGADWFRCDVVALAGPERLAALPRSSKGLVASSDRYAMCGTARPDDKDFARVPCSQDHSWVAVSTVDLPGESYPSAERAAQLMEPRCRDVAQARAEDSLDFTWSQERPTKEQWRAGQHYGICWTPA